MFNIELRFNIFFAAEDGEALSVKFSSVAQPYLAVYDPMDCRMTGFPVHRQLPELTQTHVL